ncbi:MAG: hypothetical protein NY202_03525 [Mollicutes bacterium UO1]
MEKKLNKNYINILHMTEESTKTEETVNTNTTEKGKRFKDIQESED